MKLVIACLLVARLALADDGSAAGSDAGSDVGSATGSAAVEPPPSPAEMAERIDDQEQRVRTLESKARVTESFNEDVGKLRWLPRFLTVFVDVGGFAVAGDGSGIRSDLGHVYYPKYAGRIAGQWVFMGDPLSTAINSLGEPADASDSRELRADTIHSKGRPSLIVNTVGLSIGKYLGHDISVSALAEVLPRPGDTLLDVPLAHIDWRPLSTVDLVISAGKVDSVLGVEYRSQDAPRRLGVTPSLICRYTCGRPLGAEARLVEGRLSLSGGMFASDQFDQRFEPKLELHASNLPTVAGHVQWMLPVGQGLEVGVSGAAGPQDNQPSASIAQWHVGLDAQLRDLHGWDAVAEYVQGLQQGETMSVPCDLAPCLTYKGAYVLVDRRVNDHFTPYVRVDWRSAVHQHGTDFVYESHVARATIGAHFEMTNTILAKIEYTFNHELDGIPQFADDILTTSLVVATE
ncbi:MAG: hypothetical protein JO257_07100 [Deltaproteobacteria bacterium]|nr:hypothetical protein [Deltaproteobacteria bacterium]